MTEVCCTPKHDCLFNIQSEFFRDEIVHNGVVVKGQYQSEPLKTQLHFVKIVNILLLGNYLRKTCRDVLIFCLYKLNFEKMKIELQSKRYNNFDFLRLFDFMLLEVLICSILMPPYVEYDFSGKML